MCNRCFNPCAAPLTAVKDKPDQCLKGCTGNMTSGGGMAVEGSTNCVRCSAASPQFVLALNKCFAKCATGLSGYRDLCCKPCPGV